MARRILTADDIAALPNGAQLVIDGNTTLTAPARELALRRGVQLVETAEGPSREVSAGRHPGADVAFARSAAAAPFVAGGARGTLIVSAVGVNRPRILAELSSAVGQLGGDIQDVSQRITGGYFNAILVVDIGASGQSFAAFRDALLALSKPADYVVTVIDERVFTAMHRLD